MPTRIGMAIEAFRRRFFDHPKVSHLDAWVVSPGGVGTTFLMEYISRFLTINDLHDADGLKHWPRLPNRFASSVVCPVVFITGDTQAITASIARRDWLQTQCAKLGDIWGVLAPSVWKPAAFARAVERQFRSWARIGSARILIVHYDDIWANKEIIATHLGLDVEAFSKGFPPPKQRASSPAAQGALSNAR